MKADFTRDTFSPLKHFSRVLMQQGRVQLDADWNEQVAIQLRSLRALAADLIGDHGGPADDLGLTIAELGLTPPVRNDFRIGSGRYYIDGVPCEIESTLVPIAVQQGNVVQVQSWTVDGRPFQADQYVEVVDDRPAPAFAPTLVQVKSPDPAHRTLTLQGAPAGLANPAVVPRIRHAVTYRTQPEYPVAPGPITTASGTYQVYADVWEHAITSAEDDSLREVALGGPDTTARAKVVCQVKLVGPLDAANQCLTPGQIRHRLQADANGRLRAMARPPSGSTDPCIVPPDARYRGAENQLYRVEIHRSGLGWDKTEGTRASAATFKWSRDNGSVVFPIVAGGGTTTLTLEHLGRDDRFGLAEGDWVEVQDDDWVLVNRAVPPPLLRVQAIDRLGLTVTLSGSPHPHVGIDPSRHPLLRRWDHQSGDPTEGGLQLADDGAALITESFEGGWLDLEDGVQIQFQPGPPFAPAHIYRTGDYWLIPARIATADVEWPTQPSRDASGNAATAPLALPPAGIYHRYAPLALVTIDGDGQVTGVSRDCRKRFAALAQPLP
jgi:uncharacterized protein DUF6519